MAETTFDLGTVSGELILPVWLVYLLTRVVDFGPTLAGLISAYYVAGWAGPRELFARLLRWRVSARWYLIALFLPLGFVLAALALHLIFGDSDIQGVNWQGWITIWRLFFWVILVRTLLGGGLGEEVGWRGFALPRMVSRFGLFSASLFLGLIWTFWHLPAHLVASNPVGNLIAQLLFTLPLSFIFTWLYYSSGESILIAVLFHGAINGFNVFFERELFPALLVEDGFVLMWVLVVLVVGAVFAFKLRGRKLIK